MPSARNYEVCIYKWKHRIVPEQEQLNIEIAELIKEYDERFSHILGYRRMTDWINHFNYELLEENSPNYENTRYSPLSVRKEKIQNC